MKSRYITPVMRFSLLTGAITTISDNSEQTLPMEEAYVEYEPTPSPEPDPSVNGGTNDEAEGNLPGDYFSSFEVPPVDTSIIGDDGGSGLEGIPIDPVSE